MKVHVVVSDEDSSVSLMFHFSFLFLIAISRVAGTGDPVTWPASATVASKLAQNVKTMPIMSSISSI